MSDASRKQNAGRARIDEAKPIVQGLRIQARNKCITALIPVKRDAHDPRGWTPIQLDVELLRLFSTFHGAVSLEREGGISCRVSLTVEVIYSEPPIGP